MKVELPRWPRRLITALVLIHFGVVALHGRAHAELGVELNLFQQSFAAIVIVAAPLVAGALLWTERWRGGLVLLCGALGGSLLFGVYHHYILISPDHVAHLPDGGAQGLFRSTALLMALTELGGLAIGLSGLRPAARHGTDRPG